jgi:hypothetical protein
MNSKGVLKQTPLNWSSIVAVEPTIPTHYTYDEKWMELIEEDSYGARSPRSTCVRRRGNLLGEFARLSRLFRLKDRLLFLAGQYELQRFDDLFRQHQWPSGPTVAGRY